MPRITQVTIDHPYYGPSEFGIVRNATTDIAEALELEHSCDDNCCDISAAMERGHSGAAAFLICGATDELPYLSAVISAHTFNGTMINLLEAFDAWCASVDSTPAWQCPKCDASIYCDDDDTCSNCLGTREYALPAGLTSGMVVSVARHAGVAWRIDGASRDGIDCHMIGDDHTWTHDADDLSPLSDEDYCGECGQTGCSWGH